MNIFCQQCMKHTKHIPLVDQYANECTVCHSKSISLGRVEVEANKFYTPQGSEATLVKNTDKEAIFSIDKGEEAGYYYYDKHSGFGGIQKI